MPTHLVEQLTCSRNSISFSSYHFPTVFIPLSFTTIIPPSARTLDFIFIRTVWLFSPSCIPRSPSVTSPSASCITFALFDVDVFRKILRPTMCFGSEISRPNASSVEMHNFLACTTHNNQGSTEQLRGKRRIKRKANEDVKTIAQDNVPPRNEVRFRRRLFILSDNKHILSLLLLLPHHKRIRESHRPKICSIGEVKYSYYS